MSEKINKNQNNIFIWAFKEIKCFRIAFSSLLFLGLILISLNIIIVYYTQAVVNGVVHNKINSFIQNCIFLAFFVLAQILLGILQTYISARLTSSVSFELKNRFNEKILRIRRGCKDLLNSGDINSIFNYDINILINFSSQNFYTIISQIIMAFATIVYLALANWILLVASIAIVPFAMMILNKLQKKMGNHFTAESKIRGKASNIATECSKNIEFIKAYNLQNLMCYKIKDIFKNSYDYWMKIHKAFFSILLLTIVLRNFPKFICISFGGWLALRGYLNLEQLVGFILLLDYIVSPIMSIPSILQSISSADSSLIRMDSIMNLPSERMLSDTIILNRDSSVIIEARNISFGYIEDKPVLENISFKLHRGEQIALVGKNGCGKSTILKLLTGDYEILSGDLFLYGEKYDSLSLKTIRNEISLVSQDITLFPVSIKENIALGSSIENITDEDIIEAAKLANVHQFIMKLPKKYETILDENSGNLSGGEKQKISIARAFLRDAPIILLDEPTAALDVQSEQKLNEVLEHLLKDKSVIVISHRLSTVMQSDRILIMNDGYINDEGHHDELIERSEQYKNLYIYDVNKNICGDYA